MGRRKKQIPRKPTYAIVVDGNTEIWYFNMMVRNERELNIIIKPELPKKKSLAKQYELIRELAINYSKVFWIVDLDVILKEDKERKDKSNLGINDFVKYKNKLKKDFPERVATIVNNPCTEFWFLLHFSFTTRQFVQCTKVEGELKKHLIGYEKTKHFFTKKNNDIYLKLKSYLEKGIKNSKKTGEFELENYDESISEFHKFFCDDSFKKYFCKS